MKSAQLITLTPKGLYCPKADLYIDPWYPAGKALITHGHSDHARWGQSLYVAHPITCAVMKHRLGSAIQTESVLYGEKRNINGVEVSFHPAGHIPGSAQVRLSYQGETWVISGDYKTENDGLSSPFEPILCDHFVSECTFGIPVFKWQPQEIIYSEIQQWLQKNQAEGIHSLLLGYSLGKIQRVLQGIGEVAGPIYAHGSILQMNEVLKQTGIVLPEVLPLPKTLEKGAIILAPPAAVGSPWARKLNPVRTAFVSGWMQLRGNRRRRGGDAGFVLSDHADWPGLLSAIKATGAENIYLTHGYKAILARYLREQGYQAVELDTLFEGESMESNEELASQEG